MGSVHLLVKPQHLTLGSEGGTRVLGTQTEVGMIKHRAESWVDMLTTALDCYAVPFRWDVTLRDMVSGGPIA